MRNRLMLRGGLLVVVVAVSIAALSEVASADPVNAKNGSLVTLVCGGQTLIASVNGNGEFTPGHVVGGTAMLIPTAFDLTFSFTPTGGATMSETDTSAKNNQHGNLVTCDIPEALNTFVAPEGTFSISGTVTGFFTPAKAK